MEHFIPFSKLELSEYLADQVKNKEEKKQFQNFCKLIGHIYHFQFQADQEQLKENYLCIDPDRNVEMIHKTDSEKDLKSEKKVLKELEKILIAGNYVSISENKLNEAFGKTSPWGINLKVDMSNYECLALYYRGEHPDNFDKTEYFLFKKHFDFLVYSRVVLVFKLKEDAKTLITDNQNRFQKGKLYLKLFKNVPAVDLEMLFPDTKIVIRPFDQAKVIVPLVIGIVSTVYKILEYVLKDGNPMHLWTQIGFWTLVGSLFGLSLRGFFNYKNTIEKYLKSLTTSLYFQNLDNNSGVFKYLLDDAEEEECKEIILAYYFLLTTEEKLDEESLDHTIEQFFMNHFNKEIDFEVDDAVKKLRAMKLLSGTTKDLKVLSLAESLKLLDSLWDDYYNF